MLNVGIGLTSKCNCNCEHCYSRIYGNNTFLDTGTLFNFFKTFQIESVNFGTGESFYHPDFLTIIHHLYQKNVKISVTTNGYTIANMTDEQLKLLHDVDFSLDFPMENLHDASRQPGCFQLVRDGIARCKKLGVTCSIAWCLTPDNCIYIHEMLCLCKMWDVFLRINIYKPVDGKKGFTYPLFWESMNDLFKWGNIISVSEGIVNAAIGNRYGLCGCNPSNLRIFPNGTMSSCVYVQNDGMTLEKACGMSEEDLVGYFQCQYEIPENSICTGCPDFPVCRAGCMARRKISGRDRDEFCYLDMDKAPQFERVVYSDKKSELFVHSNYICTFIMEPRSN